MIRADGQTRQFLRDLPFFAGLPEAVFSNLMNAATVRDYPKNKPIFYHGDRADRFFSVLGGWVKAFRNTEQGDESIMALFTRGDTFGEAAAFSNAEYPFSAQAAGEARLIEIPASLIRNKESADSDIMRHVMHSMSREIRKLQIENEHMAIMSASQRVGCLLLQLTSRIEGHGGSFVFPYDKSLAAARLGMTAETFSRSLAQLKSMSVHGDGTETTIGSFRCLAEHCCRNCSAELTDCKSAFRKMSLPEREKA